MSLRAVLLLILAAAACGGGKTTDARKMTERQRDSALSESGLPGAKGIGRALRAQDSGAAHQRLIDSIANAQ
jgi:hypothetical protein